MRWQDRGPTGPQERTKDTWRGQKWRPGSERWANNGGANKIWYVGFIRARDEGPEALDRFFEQNAEKFARGPNSKGGPWQLREWLKRQGLPKAAPSTASSSFEPTSMPPWRAR